MTVGLAVSLIVGRGVVGGAEGLNVVGAATGRGVVFTVGRAVMVGRAVVDGAATGRGVAFTVGRAVVGAATGRGVAFMVGRAVGEGSPAASARNRSALVAAMLTRSSNRCVQRPRLRGNAGREGLLY